MQFENGYVNRFCCRLFAAYFLPNGFASLFCNSFFRILRAVTVDSLFFCARQSFGVIFCYVWGCLLNCCMFARKLKCNDIYYIFTYHSKQRTRFSMYERLGTDITHNWLDATAGAAYANIIARFYFLSVMEINMLRPKSWLNALEMLVNCTIISHIITFEWKQQQQQRNTPEKAMKCEHKMKILWWSTKHSRLDFSQLSTQEFDSIAKTIYVHRAPDDDNQTIVEMYQ